MLARNIAKLTMIAGAALMLSATASSAAAPATAPGDTGKKMVRPVAADGIKVARKGGRGDFRGRPMRRGGVMMRHRAPRAYHRSYPRFRPIVRHRKVYRNNWRHRPYYRHRPRLRVYVPSIVFGPRYYRSSRCSYWRNRCADNWGWGNANFRGCLRYHGCR